MAKAKKMSVDDCVSIWAWAGEMPPDPEPVDTLRDLCGVEYYDVDFQEAIGGRDRAEEPIAALLGRLSYSSMFLDDAVKGAESRGLASSRWVVAQYRFAYDPKRAKAPVADNPVFLGVFRWR
jgi:hypothetical protein